MTSPQDDGTPPAPWASPAGPPAGQAPPSTPSTHVPPPAAPTATGWGEAPQPAGWGAPPQPPGWATPPAGAPAGPTGPSGAPAPQPAGRPGWRVPAVQPGIVPLRPLGLGEILDGAIRAVRANPAVMFGLSAVVVTVAVALQTVVQLYVSSLLTGPIGDVLVDSGESAGLAAEMSQSLSLGGGQLVTAPILMAVTAILTGLLIVSVSQSVIGRRVSLREVVRLRRVWLVVGFVALQTLVVVLGTGLGAFGIALAAGGLAAAGVDGAIVALTVVVLVVALLAALVWFGTRTLLAPPALMLEGQRFWPTVARAWRLTRGSFWRLLGIYLLANVLVSVVLSIIVAPAVVVAAVAAAATGSDALTIPLTALAQVVSYTVTTAFVAAVVALLYVDVRIRREGLDLELARAAAAAP